MIMKIVLKLIKVNENWSIKLAWDNMQIFSNNIYVELNEKATFVSYMAKFLR